MWEFDSSPYVENRLINQLGAVVQRAQKPDILTMNMFEEFTGESAFRPWKDCELKRELKAILAAINAVRTIDDIIPETPS